MEYYHEAIEDSITTEPIMIISAAKKQQSTLELMEYSASMVLCDKVLSVQTGNTLVLDLRGRVYLAMGDKAKACKDWSKAYELNYPVSKLRINRYCK